MAEKEITISIRMGPEEIRIMDDFMDDNGIIKRSDFVRRAITGYIRSKTEAEAELAGGIFVHLQELQMATLDNMQKTGVIFDVEEFARNCILEKIIPAESIDEAIKNSFKAAQLSSGMK